MRKCSRDDSRRLSDYSPPYATVRRSYCEQHRKLLFDNSREQSASDQPLYYEFSQDESIVNSLESSASDCRVFERRAAALLESPTTTSCLKSATFSKKKLKRVNFVDEAAYTDASLSPNSSSSQRSTHNATAIVRRRCCVTNGASNEPTMQQDYESTSEIMQSSTTSGEQGQLAKGGKYFACSSSIEKIDEKCLNYMKALEALSVSSSIHCPRTQNPRIVKPRDVLRRPATRKMIIYPPEGQRGEPMTLNKKWSRIQCRVSGDEDAGFRYKVYYLQTFESDKWFPNNKTNSPFCHRDDPDNSTDYAN